MRSLIQATVVALVLVSGVAAGELNVQGSSATGGNAEVIRGRVGGDMAFSVTGRFNDLVVIYDVFGYVVYVNDIRGLTIGDYSPFTRPRAPSQLSDGQTRVWLNLSRTPWWLDGGAVGLWSGNVWIDIDPIDLY